MIAVFRYGTAIHYAFIAIGLKSVITGDEIGRDRYVKAQPLLVTILRHHTDFVLPQFVWPQPRDIHGQCQHQLGLAVALNASNTDDLVFMDAEADVIKNLFAL